MEFEVFEPKSDKEIPGRTVTRAKATCLCCNMVLPPNRVRAQMAKQRGGADVIFDAKGNLIGGARMTAVVILHPGIQGRHYRLPTDSDYKAVWKAQKRVQEILDQWERNRRTGPCPVPDESTPAGGGSGAGRAFSVQKYGMMTFGDLFTARQKLALVGLGRMLAHSENHAEVMSGLFACAFNRVTAPSARSFSTYTSGSKSYSLSVADLAMGNRRRFCFNTNF